MPHASRSSLAPGLATGIGSLPHTDPRAAVAVSLRCTPRLPAVPQLPVRTPLEGLVAQWAGALPEVIVDPDGLVRVDGTDAHDPAPTFDRRRHAGLLAFLDEVAARSERPRRVKVQLVGPLTLGVALERAGMPADRAFRRAAEAVQAWVRALEELLARRLPGCGRLLFLDEPGLVLWARGDGPLERERAVDLLSGALAAAGCPTGVHVCGDGDRRLALEAGPDVLGVEVGAGLLADSDLVARHLDADGWVAWGAVPTDRPLGESAEPLWRDLAGVWCELTRLGCDPGRLRAQALVTPACGLAGHGATQAERALRLAVELADRVHSQALAARLTLGA